MLKRLWRWLTDARPTPADVDADRASWYERDFDSDPVFASPPRNLETLDRDIADSDDTIGDCCGNCAKDEDVAFILERLEVLMVEFDALKVTVADAVAKMQAATGALVVAADAPKAAEMQALSDALKPAVDALAAATPTA